LQIHAQLLLLENELMLLGTNPEAKHFPSISLISIIVIVIPIRESRCWLSIKEKAI